MKRVTLAVVLIGFSIAASGQSPADVLRSFRKLQADTEAGVTLDQYARGMAEVTAQMRSFSDSHAGAEPQGMADLRSALSAYRRARDAWDRQRIEDMRYANKELAISQYFDGKRRSQAAIEMLWHEASDDIDRAATRMKTGPPRR